jgi:hypothetical protein
VLPKKEPAVRIFLDSTAKVEELRHYVQHLDREIGSLAEGSPPLWGAVTWVKSDDPQTYLQLMTGSIHVKPSYQGLVYDTFERKFVRGFELHAGQTSIDLDDYWRWSKGSPPSWESGAHAFSSVTESPTNMTRQGRRLSSQLSAQWLRTNCRNAPRD